MTDIDERRLMTVGCPHCSIRYRIPSYLMGPGGARVHCPACWGSFEVNPEGDPVAEPGETRVPVLTEPTAPETPFSEPVAASEPAPSVDPCSEGEMARAVVEGLVPHTESLRDAQSRGRLLAEAGPLLLEAFDAYRQRAGRDAAIAPFHDALRAGLGIELPWAEDRRLPKRRAQGDDPEAGRDRR